MRASCVRAFALSLALLLHAQALLAQGLPTARPEDVGMSSERLARLTAVMRDYIADERLAGAVVLIARQGRVPYFEAFGASDREARAPMESDALFRIASQTKALVSVAVMMLQEEGRLLISDPLRRHLPEFAQTTVAVRRAEGDGYDVVDARRPITLRDLLTHTAGIGYGSGVAGERWDAAGIQGWYFADRAEPIGATVARMAGLPFDAQPGERFVYGYATDILGVVVERVSGMPLDAFLRTRIFEPLGMHDTAFYVAPDDAARLAAVYAATPSGLERAPSPGGMVGQGAYVEGPRRSFSGGAGLVSTAADYARFLQMLLNGGTLDGVRILAPSTVALMTADHIGDRFPTAGSGFGLGFEVTTDVGRRGQPGSVGTFGWGGAYHSTYWVDPAEELVVVYMTQLIPAGGLDDHGRLRALVYQAIVEAPAGDVR
jgi:CubicO group peptidase (beta-lactamase class C family)